MTRTPLEDLKDIKEIKRQKGDTENTPETMPKWTLGKRLLNDRENESHARNQIQQKS